MSAEIDDTYAEAFKGCYSAIQVTAKNNRWLMHAANCATGYATSTIGCGCEAGIDTLLNEKETPDNRLGAVLQFWVPTWKKDFEKELEGELLHRIGHCILTAPTTAVYNATSSEKTLPVGKKLSFFGDGHQRQEKKYGRELIVIPIMMGEFLVEENIGYDTGVMGGNLWFLGETEDAALTAAEKAVDEISKVRGTITSFPGGVCSSGSKVGSKYKFLIASTNTPHCPTLKCDLEGSCVPDNVKSISEIIINGINEEQVSKAMKYAVKTSKNSEGLVKISAGNYGGKLGKYKIYLK